ncbi:hydrogenase isoenzymes formation protein [Escherichia coli]|uniref:Hydrogenase isoenzymes formation protein n=1 Tax=Escherichia coli TaxID=562 RepID=A0A376KPN1_ECOLX|nr:hydrogenase isoenzymes formation protein [Escherichia coli]
MSVINEAEARDTLGRLTKTCLTFEPDVGALLYGEEKIMRFVDEYRAPEQVMQLIEHLRERASHLLLHRRTPLCGLWEVCGGHTHAYL